MVHIHRNHCLIMVNGLFNSRKLHTMLCRAPKTDGSQQSSDKTSSTGRGDGTPPRTSRQYTRPENLTERIKRQTDMTPHDETPQVGSVQCATWGRAGDDSSAGRRKQCYLPQHERNERIILSEATQREASITRFHLYVKSKIEHK